MGPASDGELYFITSLLFASNRWGNDTGINYLAEAQHILKCMEPRETTFPAFRNFPARTVRMSLIDEKTKLITFVPGTNHTDPSYHLPAFYEVWARYAQDGKSDYWMECAKAAREYLHKSIHPETGLTPDYNNYDGTLLNSRQLIGDAFRYDSWRVPMNIVLDYTWSGGKDEEWQRMYENKIQNFFYSQGIDTFVDQYNVDGTTPERILGAGGYTKLRHSLGIVSTLAAASLVSTNEHRMEFVDRIWNSSHLPYADGYYDAYYDGLMRLFAMMHLGGGGHDYSFFFLFLSVAGSAGFGAGLPSGSAPPAAALPRSRSPLRSSASSSAARALATPAASACARAVTFRALSAAFPQPPSASCERTSVSTARSSAPRSADGSFARTVTANACT